MFMGEYNHTIDAKGRLIIPSRFRELLGEEFVLTRGVGGCRSRSPGEGWVAVRLLSGGGGGGRVELGGGGGG